MADTGGTNAGQYVNGYGSGSDGGNPLSVISNPKLRGQLFFLQVFQGTLFIAAVLYGIIWREWDPTPSQTNIVLAILVYLLACQSVITVAKFIAGVREVNALMATARQLGQWNGSERRGDPPA